MKGDLAEDTSFRLDDGTRCALCGITMVRTGTQLAMMILGGPILENFEEARREIVELHNPGKSTYERVNQFADSDLPTEDDLKPTLVQGTDNVWQHIVLVLVDTRKPSLLGRYLYIDDGRTYRIHSDDPDIYPLGDFDPDNPPEIILRSMRELERFSTLIALGVNMAVLPSYFEYRRDVVQEERVPTGLDGKKHDRNVKKQMDLVPPGERPLLRRVSALRIMKPDHELKKEFGNVDTRNYTPPEYQVEVEGFWRRLKTPTSTGRGPDGEATLGWTWVRSHMRWRDRPKSPGTVYVKTPLDPAGGHG